MLMLQSPPPFPTIIVKPPIDSIFFDTFSVTYLTDPDLSINRSDCIEVDLLAC